MNNSTTLEKAISKAIENGWKKPSYLPRIAVQNLAWGALRDIPYWQSIVYSHDFVKSFFGTYEVCFNCGLQGKHDPYCAERSFYDEAWKYHLREMVISPDPLEYLQDNMPE